MKKCMLLLLAAGMVLTTGCAPEITPTGGTHSTLPSQTASETTVSTAPTQESTVSTVPTQESTIPTVEDTEPTYGMPAPSEDSMQPPVLENNVFAFDARLYGLNRIEKGKTFGMEVTTTNISGRDFPYVGSGKIIGASVYLSREVEGRVYTFQPDGIMLPRNLERKVIADGEVITMEWTFSDYEGVVTGTYDLHFSFQGYTGVIENFLTIL